MRAHLVPAALGLSVALGCGGGAKEEAPPDTAPPTITITSPLAGDTLTGATVEYAIDGGPAAPLPPAGGGVYATTLPLPLLDGVARSVEVAAWDRAGHSARATRAFRVDRVAPALVVGGVDATCPDACTGTVVRAADGPLRVAGTATDGSGVGSVLVRVVDDQGSDVASATVPLDPEGAFTWDWDGSSDGRFFTVAVRADDPKGNTSVVSRIVYVDRVAPSVTGSPPPTGAPRAGPLFFFSEAMARGAVEAATTLTVGGAPAAVALAWADASSFGFTPALAPFTRYQLDLGAGATDRAGNPLGPAGFQFETELIEPPLEPVAVASGARSPRVAVLRDGRPAVVYGTSGRPRVVHWDGRGAWLDAEIAVTALAGGAPDAVEPMYSGVEVLFAVRSGGTNDLRYARTADLAAWEGWAGPDPDLVASGALTTWSSTFGVFCLTWPLCDVTALFGDAAGARYATRDPGGWSEPNLVKATGAGPLARGAGNAFLDDKVYYLDTRSAASRYREVTGAISGVGRVAGAEAWRPADQVYMATPVVLFTMAAGGGAEELHLACLGATPWQKATVALPAEADVLAVAVSSSTAVVAVGLADGTVRFGTTANGTSSCLAAPAAPTWDPATLGTAGREPSVALGPDGATTWKAWVRGPAGELVIAR